jgi:phosphoribosylformylglycinamidine cyclo-ligase
VTSYRDAGVDLEGADRHVSAITGPVTATWGQQVVGGFGGFAAGVEIPAGYRRPVLMMSTDGVGTKLELARASGRWEGVGFDLVAMCVDDLVAVGARPLGFVDYMAVGALAPARDTTIVSSIAAACSSVGIPLLGGETAEHPGVMEPDGLDLAGAAVGVVERGEEVTGTRISAGDVVLGVASPNLRSNGFSLVRKVLAGVDLDSPFPGEVGTYFDVLLRPSVLYCSAVLAAIDTGEVRGAAHITGGGLPGNLARPLPEGLRAVVDTTRWEVPGVFRVIQATGDLSPTAMYETFNMGIGYCLIVPPESAQAVGDLVRSLGHDTYRIGHVEEGPRSVVMT